MVNTNPELKKRMKGGVSMFMSAVINNQNRDSDANFCLMHLNALNGSTSTLTDRQYGPRTFVNDENINSKERLASLSTDDNSSQLRHRSVSISLPPSPRVKVKSRFQGRQSHKSHVAHTHLPEIVISKSPRKDQKCKFNRAKDTKDTCDEFMEICDNDADNINLIGVSLSRSYNFESKKYLVTPPIRKSYSMDFLHSWTFDPPFHKHYQNLNSQ